MEMIAIPAGRAKIGTSDYQIQSLSDTISWVRVWFKKKFFEREQPYHQVDLSAFSIGKFAVTVKQYRRFHEAGGYTILKYWTKSGWQWRREHRIMQPAFWDDSTWTGDSQLPVIGVSWFEAVEWEFAARGLDGRMYPWGDFFDPAKCNIRSGGINKTEPVGSYNPDGESSFGCCEMVGNVSEWVLNKFFSYP